MTRLIKTLTRDLERSIYPPAAFNDTHHGRECLNSELNVVNQ